MSIFKYQPSQYYELYKNNKTQLQLPLQIRIFLSFLQSNFTQTSTIKIHNCQSVYLKLPLLQVYKNLSKHQQAYFLHEISLFLLNAFSENDELSSTTASKYSIAYGNFVVNGQFAETILGITHWLDIKCSYNEQRDTVMIDSKKINLKINLNNYLMRKSHKYKNCLVLEATIQVPIQQRKIYLFFKENIFDEIYCQLFQKIILIYGELILDMIREDLYQILGQSTQNIEQHKHIYLTSKTINQFVNVRKSLSSRVHPSKNNCTVIDNKNNCIIQTNKHNCLLYKMQSTYNMPVQQLRKIFIDRYLNSHHKYLARHQLLQTFSKRYLASYFKYEIIVDNQMKQIESIYLQEIDYHKQIMLTMIPYLWQETSENMFQYLQFIVKQEGNTSKLIINAKVCISSNKDKNNNKFISEFLKQFNEMLVREEPMIDNILLEKINKNQTNLLESTQEFYSFIGNEVSSEPCQSIQECQQMQQPFQNHVHKQQPKTTQRNKKFHNILQDGQSKINTFHKNKYELYPQNRIIHKQKTDNHYLFKNWYRQKKGGLICRDSTSIKQQSKLAKHILKKLGQNVLKQKGLFKVSLPVSIFCPQSHLSCIARNLCFAPVLLEKAAQSNQEERLKYTILYALSVSIFSISVKKPFNPILGETFQAWIDGCPVYVEQISHHPPIASYYYIGRGFKAYGNIEIKANFGLNWIYGYSQQPNYVQFDDGCKIQLNFGKMMISGILFGQRQFNIADRIYAFDKRNMIFGEISCSQKKNKHNSSQTSPYDYIQGQICEISHKFVKDFNISHSKINTQNQNYISKKLSIIDGIWCGKIFFNKQQYFNFQKQRPCLIEKQQNPLPSDSVHRKDIKRLLQNQIKQSQRQKQFLEQIQRRDRKLRKINSVS